MEYTQRNPVPLPASGASGEVASTVKTIFDWRYALEEQQLLSLYEKGKRLNWNATELAWSTDVDVERMAREARVDQVFNDFMKAPKRLGIEEAVQLRVHQNANLLSQFLHGEQGALIATAKIVQTVPWEEAKFYAASQVMDEARHVEVYHRYLTEKLALSYPVNPSLQTLLDEIIRDSRWDITYLGMQILVEGLALAAFGMLKLTMGGEPLIQDITTRIMADESRHVAFGVLSLKKAYAQEMSAQELKDREDFIMEATQLLQERLTQGMVIDRLGWPRDPWVQWLDESPFNRAMRQMMFSKIVPNLKRLGLLTPRVRAHFERLNLIRFEHEKDSVEEPEVQPPQELIQMLVEYLARVEQEQKQAKGQA
jgi:hypothetical protein